MKEPRLFKHPNGGVLCLDTTLMQMGLSRCRSIAEAALEKGCVDEGAEEAFRAIIGEVKDTLYQMGQDRDEIETLLGGL